LRCQQFRWLSSSRSDRSLVDDAGTLCAHSKPSKRQSTCGSAL
jgi:hypothetical protein